MAESLTMTRGQLHDLLAGFAVENPKYREALINDPKMVLEKQLGSSLGSLKVQPVVETPDTMYVVVPYVQKEGEQKTEGSQTIYVPDELAIVRMEKAPDRSVLQPGKKAFLVVRDGADGTHDVLAVIVGEEGAVPPM